MWFGGGAPQGGPPPGPPQPVDLNQLAAMMMMSTQATQQSVQNLADTMTNAENRRMQNQGFRQLKPKREMTGLTAESAKIFMF